MRLNQSWAKFLHGKKPKKTRVPAPPSIGEETFALHLKSDNVPDPHRQYTPCGDRDWTVDFAWPTKKLAIEIQGGNWKGGAHVRPKRYEEDVRKLNWLNAHGWTTLWFTTDMVTSGEAIDTTKPILAQLQLPRRQAG